MPRLLLAALGDATGVGQIRAFVAAEQQRFQQCQAAKSIQKQARAFLRHRLLQSFLERRRAIKQHNSAAALGRLLSIFRLRQLQVRFGCARFFALWRQLVAQKRRAVEFWQFKAVKRAFAGLVDESAGVIGQYWARYQHIIEQFQKSAQRTTALQSLRFMRLRLRCLKGLYGGRTAEQVFGDIYAAGSEIPPQFERFRLKILKIEGQLAKIHLSALLKLLLRPAFFAWFRRTWSEAKDLIQGKLVRRQLVWAYGHYFHQLAISLRVQKDRKRYYFAIWKHFVGISVDQSLKNRYCDKFQRRHYISLYFQMWKKFILLRDVLATGRVVKNFFGNNAVFQSFDDNSQPILEQPLALKRRSSVAILFCTLNDARYKPIATAVKCLFAWKQLPRQRKAFSRFVLLMFGLFNVVRAKLRMRLWQYYAQEVRNSAIAGVRAGEAYGDADDDQQAQQDANEDEDELFDQAFVQRVYDGICQEVVTYDLVYSLISLVRSSIGHALLTLRQNEKIEAESQALLHKYKRLVLTLNDQEVEESIRTIFSRPDVGAFIRYFWRSILQIYTQRRRQLASDAEEYRKQLVKPEMDEEKQLSNHYFQLKAVEKQLSRRYLNYLIAVEQHFKSNIVQTEPCQQQLIQIFSQKNPELATYIQGIDGINFSIAWTAFQFQGVAEIQVADVQLQTTAFSVCNYLQFDPHAVPATFSFFTKFDLYQNTAISTIKDNYIERVKNTKRAIAAQTFRNKFPPRPTYQETDRLQEWLVGTLTTCLSGEYSGIARTRAYVVGILLQRACRHNAEQKCLLTYDQLAAQSSDSEIAEISAEAAQRTDEYVLRAFDYDSAGEQAFISEVMRNQSSFGGDLFVDIDQQLQASNLRKMQLSKQQAERDFEFLKKSRASKQRGRGDAQRLELAKKQLIMRLKAQNGGELGGKIDQIQGISDEEELKKYVKRAFKGGEAIDIDDEFWKEIMAQRIKDELWAHNELLAGGDSSSQKLLSDRTSASRGRSQSTVDGRSVAHTSTSPLDSRTASRPEVGANTSEQAAKEKRRATKKTVLQSQTALMQKSSAAQQSAAAKKAEVEFRTENVVLNAQGAVWQQKLRGKKLPSAMPRQLVNNLAQRQQGTDSDAGLHNSRQAEVSGANCPATLQASQSGVLDPLRARQPSKLDLLAAQQFKRLQEQKAHASNGDIIIADPLGLLSRPMNLDELVREENQATAASILLQDDALCDDLLSDSEDVAALQSELQRYAAKTDAEVRELLLQEAGGASNEEEIAAKLDEIARQRQTLVQLESKRARLAEEAKANGVDITELENAQNTEKEARQQRVLAKIMRETGASEAEATRLLGDAKKALREARDTNRQGAKAFVQKLNQFTILEDVVADETSTTRTGFPALDAHAARLDFLAYPHGQSQAESPQKLATSSQKLAQLATSPDLPGVLAASRKSSEQITSAAAEQTLFADTTAAETGQHTGISRQGTLSRHIASRGARSVLGTPENGTRREQDAQQTELGWQGSGERLPASREETSAQKRLEAKGAGPLDEEPTHNVVKSGETGKHGRRSSEDPDQPAVQHEHASINLAVSESQDSKRPADLFANQQAFEEVANEMRGAQERITGSRAIRHDLLTRNSPAGTLGPEDSKQAKRTEDLGVDQAAEKQPSQECSSLGRTVESLQPDDVLTASQTGQDPQEQASQQQAAEAGHGNAFLGLLAAKTRNQLSFVQQKVEEYRKRSRAGQRCSTASDIAQNLMELKKHGILGVKVCDRVLKRAASAPQTYYRVARHLRAMQLRPLSAMVLRTRNITKRGSLQAVLSAQARARSNSQRRERSAADEDIQLIVSLAHVPKTLEYKNLAPMEHTSSCRDVYELANARAEKVSKALRQQKEDSNQILNQIVSQSQSRQAAGWAQRGEPASSQGSKKGRSQGKNAAVGVQKDLNIVEITYDTEKPQQRAEESAEEEIVLQGQDQPPGKNIFNDFDKLFARVGVSRLQDIVAQRHQELMRAIAQESAEDEFTKRLSELAKKTMRKQAKKLQRQRAEREATLAVADAAPSGDDLLLSTAGAGEKLDASPPVQTDLEHTNATQLLRRRLVSGDFVVLTGDQLRGSAARGLADSTVRIQPPEGKIASPHKTLRYAKSAKRYRPLMVLKTQGFPDSPGFSTRVLSKQPLSTCDVSVIDQLERSIASKTTQQQRIMQASRTGDQNSQ